jgi:protein TonB
MDWAADWRWRKAMLISLVLHSIVLICVGWLAGRAVLPEPIPETVIELELTDWAEGPLLADTEPAAAPASQQVLPAMPQPVPVVRPAAVQPVAATDPVLPEAVVAASDMAVVAVDASAVAASAPAGGSGGGSSDGSAAAGSGQGGGRGGSGSGKAGGVIPPGILSQREPNYPEQARRAGIEGTVVLKIEILANGQAGQVYVFRSSGSELLDNAAADAVRRWRFVPAKLRETGQTIVCQTTMPVVFRLRT